MNKCTLFEAILRTMPWRTTIWRKPRPSAPVPPQARTSLAESEDVLDTNVFDDFAAEVGRDSTAQIFSLFINDTEQRLKKMRLLSGSVDRKAVENQAHAMKGSAATFGFRQIWMLSAALESDAPGLTDADYRTRLGELETAFSVARQQYMDRFAVAA